MASSKILAVHRIRRESSSDNVCTLCYHEASSWVVSPCDHIMCLTCACRLRVLCDMKECPVCRENCEKVFVVEKRSPFSSISLPKMIRGNKNGFLFENRRLIDSFDSLKTIYCVKCSQDSDSSDNMRRFSNMKHLQDHLRKEHQLYTCEICVAHLKLFPHEHKLYTRDQLARHRRVGDPEDSAHKGHPLCQFCEDHFLDTDALFFHLKDKHFWCHFCEADGKQDYYADYSELRAHFKQKHYLCSEGQCRYEKFTSVFRTKLDFQAHRAREHSKGLTKAEAKQLRHVDVGFVYSREDATSNGGMPPVSARQYGRRRQGGIMRESDEDIEVAKALSEQVLKDSSSSGTSSEETTPDPLPNAIVNPLSNTTTTSDTIVQQASAPSNSDTSPVHDQEWPSLSSGGDKDTALPINPPPPPLPPPPPGFTVPTAKDKADMSTVSKDKPSVPTAKSKAPVPTAKDKAHVSNKVSASTAKDRFVIEEPFKEDSPNDIFEIAQALLDNNKKKISLFRNCSGLYQRGEISVSDYYQQCSSLFGTSWTSIGLRLARTLPDPVKRKELHSMFEGSSYNEWPPPPGLSKLPSGPPLSSRPPEFPAAVSHAKKNKKNKGSTKNQVHETSTVNKPWGDYAIKQSSLNDEEFPSLQKASTMPDPVTAPPGWNRKVTVVK